MVLCLHIQLIFLLAGNIHMYGISTALGSVFAWCMDVGSNGISMRGFICHLNKINSRLYIYFLHIC